MRAFHNIWKIATGQGDDYTTDYLEDYPYLKEHCKMIAIDLSKQQALDPKTKQQNDFTANIARDGSKTIFFIIEEAKKTILDFSREIVRIL